MIGIGVLDHPGARSSHTVPTPKGGGVGIAASFIIGLCLVFGTVGQARLPNLPFLGLIVASVGIALVSYADDVRNWPFTAKLGAQMAAALITIACGLRLRTIHLPVIGAVDTAWWGIPLTAAWIVFATNAVNFIDGLNGLASGSVAIACVFLASIAWVEGDWFSHAVAMFLSAAIFGFLPFNFPRARIFMGDVGSQFCGFVVAVLGVVAAGNGPQTLSVLLVPMLLFGILFDVAFTLCRRLAAGERLTVAHRSHLYQIAVRAGMRPARVTLVYWAMTAWGGAICILFADTIGPLKAAIPLLVLPPQIVWAAYVYRAARQEHVGRW